MTDISNPALALLDTWLDQTGIVDQSGVADAESVAVDMAARTLGTEVVDYVGVDRAVRPRGGGNMYAERQASVAAASAGPGLMARIAGHGTLDAKGVNIITGRVAQGEHGTALSFAIALTGNAISWNNSNAGYINMDRLTLSVPCAAGVTTLLQVDATIEVHPANTATGIEASLNVGEAAPGVPWLNNADTPFGPVWTTGYDGGWFTVSLAHERVILGNADTANIDKGVKIFPRIRRIGGASGGYSGGNKLEAGATFKTTSEVNIRYLPTTDSEILAVAPSGSVGVISSGPYSANGYAWYQVSITGVGAGYVASNYISVTNNDQPPPTTNYIRNALLTCRRTPL